MKWKKSDHAPIVLQLNIPIDHHIQVSIKHKPRKNGTLLAMIRLLTIS